MILGVNDNFAKRTNHRSPSWLNLSQEDIGKGRYSQKANTWTVPFHYRRLDEGSRSRELVSRKPIHGSELEKHVAVEVTEEPGFAEITQDIALGKRRLFWIENGEQPDSSFWMNFRL